MKQSCHMKERHLHPVDVIEQIVHHQDWSFERVVKDEIVFQVHGQLSSYHISFSWVEVFETLHIGCSFALSIAPKQRSRMVDLLSLINEKMLMGHFDYWQDTGEVIYRQSLLLSGGLHPTDAQIIMLLSTALDACELHFPACERVTHDAVPALEALRYAMFETLGNA